MGRERLVLKIGEFSRYARLSIRMLRHYDAEDGTPLVDLKPYTPSIDRIATPRVPAWCANWPNDVETSGQFDWGAVFRF